jgi:Zn-dependent M32 family carboxypeptidase
MGRHHAQKSKVNEDVARRDFTATTEWRRKNAWQEASK